MVSSTLSSGLLKEVPPVAAGQKLCKFPLVGGFSPSDCVLCAFSRQCLQFVLLLMTPVGR